MCQVSYVHNTSNNDFEVFEKKFMTLIFFFFFFLISKSKIWAQNVTQSTKKSEKPKLVLRYDIVQHPETLVLQMTL